MKRIFIKTSALIILSQSQMGFAETGLLFNVNAAGSILNITTTIPQHAYANAGIKLNTPGYSLTSCQKNIDGYCLFSVSDTMPASLLVKGPKGMLSATLCLQGEGPLSCQDYNIFMTSSSSPRFAYISDSSVSVSSPSVSQCSLDPMTGAIISCTEIPLPEVPSDVTFNAAGTFAYIASSFNVYVCNVNPTTGNFSNCTATGSGFNIPSTITLNPAGTFAYVSGSGVTKCSVNQTTGALSDCAATGSGFNGPSGITFNSSGTFAYVGNQLGSVLSLCAVDATTGDLNSCAPASNFHFNQPTWVALNPFNTTAYVTNNGNGTVLQCRVSSTGLIPGCAPTGDFAFNLPYSIAINSTGTMVYISNSYNSVVQCSVDATSGALVGCAVTGPTFGNILGITLYS